MAEIIGIIATLISTALTAWVSYSEKKLLSLMEEKQAYSPEHATSLNLNEFMAKRVFSKLLKKGIILQEGSNFYLDKNRQKERQSIKLKRLKIIIPIILLIIIILYLTL